MLAAVRLGRHRRGQRPGQPLTGGVLKVVGGGKERLRLLSKGVEGLAACPKLSFSVAQQGHEAPARPPALAAQTPQDLCPRLWEMGGVAP